MSDELVAAGFWFLLGFFVASWLAYKSQAKRRIQSLESFRTAKSEILKLLQDVREVTEIRVTIHDEDGELEVTTEEAPLPPPKKDLH